MNPLISVIIPTYNRENTIEKSLQSVVNQTYKTIEIIVIDDGSIDNTENIVKNIQDERILYIKQENKGVSRARNTGILNSKGEYIAFQDSDDIWHTNKLEVQMKNFRGSQCGLVYSSFNKIYRNKISVMPKMKRGKEGDIHFDLLKSNFIGCPTVIIKKEVIEKCGKFDENLHKYEDWEYFIRISKKYKVLFVEEVLVDSYYSPEGVNKFDKKISINYLNQIIKKNQNDYLENIYLFILAYYFRVIRLLFKEKLFLSGLKVFICMIKFILSNDKKNSWEIK